MHVVMLLYPNLTQLDLTGPYEVLARYKELTLHLAWKDSAPVRDGSGLQIVPTCSFDDCPQADILFVPGGPGIAALMEDAQVLDFLRKQAAGARYVTSVCTGSLVLAAAGLLTGYRATCHWLSLPQLAFFGAEPVSERVVHDRNRITGAGVTSGIDFALSLMAALFGEDRAKATQLMIEYDPAAPFAGGSPSSASPETLAAVKTITDAFQAKREEVSRRAAAALRKAAGASEAGSSGI